MRRTEYDSRRQRWLDGFVSDLRAEVRRLRPGLPGKDSDSWNVLMAVLLGEVLADEEAWRKGDFPGGRQISYDRLTEATGFSRFVVRRYLQEAAQAGILKGVCVFSSATNRQRPLEVIPNPSILMAYRESAKEGIRKQLARVFAEVWVSRLDFDGPVQGFEAVCKWGRYSEADAEVGTEVRPEPAVPEQPREVGSGAPAPREEGATRRNWMDEVRKASEGGRRRRDEKAEREALRKERKEASDAFVAGCARVWTINMARGGMGNAAPIWAGSGTALSPTGRKQRVELVKIFEQYGGMQSALAWSIFCGSSQKVDSKGKIVFDPSNAHTQWTTPDKKPEHFAKHLPMIMRDLLLHGWIDNPELHSRMRELYGVVADRQAGDKAAIDVTPYQQEPQTNGVPEAQAAASR